MSRKLKVAVLVGSLREASLSRKMAHALAGVAPGSLALTQIAIGDLPLYDEDREADPPEAWTRFRGEVREADAALFVTPEYNRSVPGALKNAIDVGSRPYGASAWAGRPAGVVSVSPGALGGFGANHHLRQSLVFLDMPVLQQPEAYLGGAAGFFAEDGTCANEGIGAFARRFMEAFAAWAERFAPGAA